MSDRRDPQADGEQQRLRLAMERRGPVETRLRANRGQVSIVRERDESIERLIRAAAPTPGRLLDLGCGEGTTLGRLIAVGAVASGVGVDLLPERIARARANWPGIEFAVADAGHLPFDPCSFDVVLTMTVFSSVPRAARPHVVAEIARVLRPGGALVWYDMRLPSPSNPDVRPFTASDVARLLPGWTMQVQRLTVLPPIARRLGPATDAIYPLLTRVPLILSHEAGLVRRPMAS